MTIFKKRWRILLIAMLPLLVVAAYDTGEYLEKHHRSLMEHVNYGIATLILLASFYCIALLVHTIWTTFRDDDHR